MSRPWNHRRVSRSAVLVAVITALAMALPAGPAAARRGPQVLLDGLSSPKGLTIAPNQNPVVSQGAFGPPGPVIEYLLRGRRHHGDKTRELTGPAALIDIAATRDGGGWAITSDEPRLLLRANRHGDISTVLDITAYQAAHPDPYDQEGAPEESNPYGLAALPNGDALVSDAAHNNLLRVTKRGTVTIVARFLPEMISTDHIPGFPVPEVNAEAVPTTVTIGPDGKAYVGELKGFPFRPGSSRIWRVDPRASGATCSSAGSSRGCKEYAHGFTAIQDIAFNRHNGAMYVYELAEDGVAAFEEGFATGEFPPAVLLKVRRGHRSEIAAGQLSEPGGVAVARNGTVFVTDGVFSSGRLLKLKEEHH